MLTIGSLFAGYGGLDMGIQQAIPARTAWVSEIDPGACKVLAHRYPDVPNHGDITRIDWSQVEPVDIIAGGSPCQDLSTAGRRAGMTEGTRSNLWVQMREAIAHVQPTFVVWENVRGSLSAHASSDLEPCSGCVGDGGDKPSLRALGRVLGDLAELGFDAEVRSLRAADVGACHGRFRVFLLAWRRDAAADDARGRRGHEAVEHDGRGAPTGDWAGVPHQPDRHVDGFGSDGALTLLPTPRVTQAGYANDGRGGRSLDVEARLLPTPVADNSRGLPSEGTAFQSLPNAVAALLPTPSVADTQGGRKHRSGDRSDELLLNGIAHHDRWGDYAAAIARHEQAVGRPAPAPTEPGHKGQPRLAARFVEWMMMLPDGWITDVPAITRTQALKMLGNGVVPAQAAAALRHMFATLETEARAAA